MSYAGTSIPPQPLVPPEGTDSNQGHIDTDFARRNRDINAPYVPYTPVLSGTSGGFTYGTGASQEGRWKRIGSQVFVYFEINFGNPGFVSGGATTWEISLPIPYVFPSLMGSPPTAWPQFILGVVCVRQGIGLQQNLHSAVPGVDVNNIEVLLSNAAVSTRLTGTSGWAQAGIIMGNLTYECKP